MTPDEEDFEERAAIVEEGNPGMTRAEAERIVRQWQQDRQRLPLNLTVVLRGDKA